jgi:flagellar protein FliO/FliZ
MNYGAVFLCSISTVFAAVDVDSKKTGTMVTSDHVLNWSLGLIVVLCLFFVCLWFMRKMGALPTSTKQNMKVISGLSLGMREKLVLVQVGDKQLLLGVTSNRIDNLLVLEGDEQLFKDNPEDHADSEFSKKLKQLMAGSINE